MNLENIFFTNRPNINKENIKKIIKFSEQELLIEENSGSKYIYNSIDNSIRGVRYKDKLTDEDNKKEFKYRLRNAILLSGITQKELAEQAHISEVSVSRYLNGVRIPNYITTKKLADVLGISVNDLYL